jgi:hypothetical protein
MLANFLAVRDMANLRSFCFYYGRPKHRVHISAIADQKALGGLRILERSIQVPQIAEKNGKPVDLRAARSSYKYGEFRAGDIASLQL